MENFKEDPLPPIFIFVKHISPKQCRSIDVKKSSASLCSNVIYVQLLNFLINLHLKALIIFCTFLQAMSKKMFYVCVGAVVIFPILFYFPKFFEYRYDKFVQVILTTIWHLMQISSTSNENTFSMKFEQLFCTYVLCRFVII